MVGTRQVLIKCKPRSAAGLLPQVGEGMQADSGLPGTVCRAVAVELLFGSGGGAASTHTLGKQCGLSSGLGNPHLFLCRLAVFGTSRSL